MLDKLITFKNNKLKTLQEIMVFDEEVWKADCTRVAEKIADTLGLKSSIEGKIFLDTNTPSDLVKELDRVLSNGKRWYMRSVALAYIATERAIVQKVGYGSG